jgi:hypothetical protein
MGMSTHVVGFRPADKQWEKMKAVWVTCNDAGIPTPDEVDDFFDGEDPTTFNGMPVKLGDAVTKFNGDCQDGYEIDVTKLPKGVKIIRVV